MNAALLLFPGALFGAGLALSGMTDPRRVLGFLDVAGAWDPTLMAVLAGALGSFALLYHLMNARAAPRPGRPAWPAPPSQRITARTCVGAVIFGVGWGLSGFCPGPALANLALLRAEAVWFVVAMLVGMLVAQRTAGADG